MSKWLSYQDYASFGKETGFIYTYALYKFKTVKMGSFKATKIGKVQIYSPQLFKRTTN